MSKNNKANQLKSNNGQSVEDAGAALSAAIAPAENKVSESVSEETEEATEATENHEVPNHEFQDGTGKTAAETSNYVADFGSDILGWTEQQIDYAATVPAIVAICKAVVAKAEPATVVEEPKKLTPEEMEAINYQRLVDTYGKDFVTAARGNEKKYFSRRSWGLMGAKKDGWMEVKKTMPEMNKGKK